MDRSTKRQSRNINWIFGALVGFCTFAWFAHTYAPTEPVHFIPFFILLFCSTVSLLLYLTNNVRRSILISIGFVIFLLLRLVGLRDVLYALLLLASLVAIEFAFSSSD